LGRGADEVRGQQKLPLDRKTSFRCTTSHVCYGLGSNRMRISEVLTLARGTGKVTPAIPSLTCFSKKIPAWRPSGLPTDGTSVCGAALGSAPALQHGSAVLVCHALLRPPPGNHLERSSAQKGPFTKIFSDKTIPDIQKTHLVFGVHMRTE